MCACVCVRITSTEGETYTGIVHKDIEALLFGSEGLNRGLNGREIRQVKMQKLKLTFALGRCPFDT